MRIDEMRANFFVGETRGLEHCPVSQKVLFSVVILVYEILFWLVST